MITITGDVLGARKLTRTTVNSCAAINVGSPAFLPSFSDIRSALSPGSPSDAEFVIAWGGDTIATINAGNAATEWPKCDGYLYNILTTSVQTPINV